MLAGLLSRSAGGDECAFAKLYDETRTRLYGLAVKVVLDRAQAEEVTQEAYLTIWRTCSRFEPRRGSALSWMLRILHSTAVDRVRSSQSRSNRENNHHRLIDRDGAEPSDVTLDAAQSSMDGERVRKALSQLPLAKRKALELAYFGGFTTSEVSEITGSSLGTTKTRIRDGLIQLRGLLADPS